MKQNVYSLSKIGEICLVYRDMEKCFTPRFDIRKNLFSYVLNFKNSCSYTS